MKNIPDNSPTLAVIIELPNVDVLVAKQLTHEIHLCLMNVYFTFCMSSR